MPTPKSAPYTFKLWLNKQTDSSSIFQELLLTLGRWELERINGQPDILRIKAPGVGTGKVLDVDYTFFQDISWIEPDAEVLATKIIQESLRSLILVPDQYSAFKKTWFYYTQKEKLYDQIGHTVF